LLVGLGNPGQKYAQTRHNAGFWLVDQFSSRYYCELAHKAKFKSVIGQVGIGKDDWVILKPSTYMNRSGCAVRQVSQYYNIARENMLIAHDELDFAPGLVRFKRGGGHGGHNGLRDIIAQLGGAEFARLRIGIGRSGDMVSYVLKSPCKQQRFEIDRSIQRAVELLPDLLGAHSQQAIQSLHVSSLNC